MEVEQCVIWRGVELKGNDTQVLAAGSTELGINEIGSNVL